jgi:hypothetical protein
MAERLPFLDVVLLNQVDLRIRREASPLDDLQGAVKLAAVDYDDSLRCAGLLEHQQRFGRQASQTEDAGLNVRRVADHLQPCKARKHAHIRHAPETNEQCVFGYVIRHRHLSS